jgi:hypothetical protein
LDIKYEPTEGFIVSIENLKKDFLNAETTYDKYKAFEKAIEWIKTSDELKWYLSEKYKETLVKLDRYEK